MTTCYTESELTEGRQRIGELLPSLMAENVVDRRRGSAMAPEPGNRSSQQFTDLLRAEHLHALVVYRRGTGWYADLILRGLPVGIPTVLGTPASTPRKSRSEAEAEGRQILKSILCVIHENEHASRDRMPDTSQRYFWLHDTEIFLPVEIIEQIARGRQSLALTGGYVPGVDEVLALLRSELIAIFGQDRFMAEVWERVDTVRKEIVTFLIANLIAMGCPRYPEHPSQGSR
ncbi:hypothetical protein ACEUZ9_001119 [Paracoccus litorisediminis]|uniref:hypothetical protein n=1 Tax=Paracoccus litorisediminis TaxID=2006130 RepID=UPI00372FB8A2